MRPYLRIEKPCAESRENMHDIPEGKFCDLCSKEVIDFSILNDSEISKILQENRDKKVCGFFYKNQLNRPLQEEKIIFHSSRKTTFYKVAAGLALTASIFNSYPAQTKNSVKKEVVASANLKTQTGKQEKKTDEGNFIILGKTVSSDKQQPISATVSFITAVKIYTTKTDQEGNYSLEVPKEILKQESLLEFNPDNYIYDRKLAIFNIQNLGKKQLIKLDYNGLDKMMGVVEFGPVQASEKSLVIVDGKKLDYKTFNKSYTLFHSRYEVHYIPKGFVKFFTTKDTIDDLFIVFVK